jgi:hypothetical protein
MSKVMTIPIDTKYLSRYMLKNMPTILLDLILPFTYRAMIKPVQQFHISELQLALP